MTAQAVLKGISIEPLDPSTHDRAAFSCGTVRLDNFLKRTARKHQAGDLTRVWVATENGADILGYYAAECPCARRRRPPRSSDEECPPVWQASRPSTFR